MELYFLNGNFAAVSPPVDTAVSAVWSLRYGECGTFAMEIPLTAGTADGTAYTPGELLSLASGAAYLCDRQFCGRIETVICRDNTLRLGGRLLECLLYDRVAGAECAYSGTAGQAVLAALRQWAGDLPFILPDTVPDLTASSVFPMETGENLGKWIHHLLYPLGAGYTVELRDGQLFFDIVQGVDRSLDSAPGVNRAIFSEDFGNIAGLETELYRENVLNWIYVEGSDGTLVPVNRSGGSDWRREGYRKASDIRPDQYGSTAAYQAALVKRGEELLDANRETARVSCVGEYEALPRYGTDYRLGDICEVQGDTLGVRRALRLTAVDVVSEGGTVKLYPFFGDTVRKIRDLK